MLVTVRTVVKFLFCPKTIRTKHLAGKRLASVPMKSKGMVESTHTGNGLEIEKNSTLSVLLEDLRKKRRLRLNEKPAGQGKKGNAFAIVNFR